MPAGTGDHRDQPDVWQAGDYATDVPALKAKLIERTTLVLGPIAETAGFQAIPEAIGFVAIDVDYYSSAVDALREGTCLQCPTSAPRTTPGSMRPVIAEAE